MRLQLSRLALDDLTRIHDFTLAEWGERQAIKYLNMLWDALEEIQDAPGRGRLRNDIYQGCRARVCGRHLIIYRARPGVIHVSRVVHGAMNLRDHVPPDFMGE
jgi:plasmid stabilization system protein ParE